MYGWVLTAGDRNIYFIVLTLAYLGYKSMESLEMYRLPMFVYYFEYVVCRRDNKVKQIVLINVSKMGTCMIV